MCNFRSELTFSQIGFSTTNTQNNVFCEGIMDLCILKSELTILKVSFYTVNNLKRRVLKWIIAFVQFKVRVGNCTKLTFQSKTQTKTCFAVEYRICAISSQCWHLHKSEFLLQNTQKVIFCGGIFHMYNLKAELTVTQTWFSTVKYS